MLWVVTGVILVALSLRGPIVAPAPVIADIQAEVGFSAAAAGLLTSLPVLFFALATPLATRVIRRAGPEAAILLCLLGVLVGSIIRSAGPAPVVLLGTIVIGAAIAVGNIVVPVLIRRDVPWQRVSGVTAAYTSALNLGSMITSLGTAPLAAVVGWRWALAGWAVLPLAGFIFWIGISRRRAHAPSAAPAAPSPSRGSGRVRRIGWLLTLAFCGQALAYYSVTAWLPTLLADTRGLGLAVSGATASLFQVAAIAGALGTAVLAARSPPWVPVAVIGILWVSLPLGLLLGPEWYVLWAIAGGIAQGGGFTTIFSIVARVTRSDGEAAGMSARVQTWGYLSAAAGPPLAGALHAATGSWDAPLVLVLVSTLAFIAGGTLVALETRRPSDG
ncbi:MFS transporter [Arthrobacter sp. Br18]|uniref:MFS transporter n=1 Tax=Arthrobacter sp. Br18 TaxID=1312954 RepID=UPI0004B5A09E|nr:MFS transporter [Arthrobacter sp. Br18]